MAKKKPTKRADTATARKDLEAVGRFLRYQARHSVLSAEKRRLQWATTCIADYLEGRSASLDHAFGLVEKQGNPGRIKVWAERAELADAEGLTVAQVAAKYGLSDEKSVRDGLKRGREINHRKYIAEAGAKIGAELAEEREKELAVRRREVRQHMKFHKIRVARTGGG